MSGLTYVARGVVAVALSLVAVSASAQAVADTPKPFEPVSGQAGKDVVWVPTPQATVDKMLDLTKVTPQDVVMDLGSGNGITVITAAKRGATAVGVEFNPEMVALARRLATEAGVSGKATFVQGDLFEADLSKATVITLFLLPDINERLRPKLLDLKPGTRIASNSFDMGDWQPDAKATSEGCQSWCTVMSWVVPAKVEGSWTARAGHLGAHAAVPDDLGDAREDADHGRQAERRRHLVHGGKPRVHGSRVRRPHHRRWLVGLEDAVAGGG